MQKIIELPADIKTTLLSRKNRFLGVVEGNIEVHIHDPGRLEELLFPGSEVLIKKAHGKNRKTNWDLIAARAPEDGSWVLVHSGYHRQISERILKDMFPASRIRAEVKLGKSRIDFMIENPKTAVEVKGCTLAKEKIALFPDAPTTRGTRHVRELIEFAKHGNSLLMILIFRNAKCFAPNSKTDPNFAAAFRDALRAGVQVMPLTLHYDGTAIWLDGRIPVCNQSD